MTSIFLQTLFFFNESFISLTSDVNYLVLLVFFIYHKQIKKIISNYEKRNKNIKKNLKKKLPGNTKSIRII